MEMAGKELQSNKVFSCQIILIFSLGHSASPGSGPEQYLVKEVVPVSDARWCRFRTEVFIPARSNPCGNFLAPLISALHNLLMISSFHSELEYLRHNL